MCVNVWAVVHMACFFDIGGAGIGTLSGFEVSAQTEANYVMARSKSGGEVEGFRGFTSVVALERHVRRVLGLGGSKATDLLECLRPHHPSRGHVPVHTWGVQAGPLRVTADGCVFSWRDCCRSAIMGRDHVRAQRFRRHRTDAFRAEVRGQITAFRDTQPAAGELEVDHDPAGGRFTELVDGFMEGRPRLYASDLGVGPVLADRGLARAWRAYHQSRARLRLLTPTDNKRGNAGFKKKRRTTST